MSSFLLDTHALLWFAHRPEKLSDRVHEALSDGSNVLLISPVSAMEIATKSRTGKLQFPTDLAHDFVRQTSGHGIEELPITAAHAQWAGSLDHRHGDPWDRLLAAQSAIESVPLVTVDPFFATIGTSVFW